MTQHIAFIPLRSGSKRLPGKNMKTFAGKPLAWWAIQAAFESTSIGRVIVAIDKPLMSQVSSLIDAQKNKSAEKVEIYLRSAKSARDGAYTEDVMLEWIMQEYEHPDFSADRFLLIQATNPFTTAAHLDNALEKFERGHSGAVMSCAPIDKFLWRRVDARHIDPLNYNRYERQRSQVWSDNNYYIENGAFYLSTIQNIWRSKNRMGGAVEPYPMEWYSTFEIDDEFDFELAEFIFKKRHQYGK